MDDAWDNIGEIVDWLDSVRTLPPEMELLMRIMKITEEAGEVSEAVTGTTGQNPRKGVTHTWDDVAAELCDVILTAMTALATLTPDGRKVFSEHLNRVADRCRELRPTALPVRGRLPAGECHGAWYAIRCAVGIPVGGAWRRWGRGCHQPARPMSRWQADASRPVDGADTDSQRRAPGVHLVVVLYRSH